MQIVLLGLLASILSFAVAHPLPRPCSDVAHCVKRSISSQITDNTKADSDTTSSSVEELETQREKLVEESQPVQKELQAWLNKHQQAGRNKALYQEELNKLLGYHEEISKLDDQIAKLKKTPGELTPIDSSSPTGPPWWQTSGSLGGAQTAKHKRHASRAR